MKPKIFVSSTVRDFEDLRSSIHFYLEDYGYEVQMSEYPNFKIDLDSSAVDTCIKNLRKCQYFVLLIGYRRGSWYEEGKLSVTHKEFLTAKSLIEAGHKLRIIAFIRKPIWLLREDRNALIKHFKSIKKSLGEDAARLSSSVIDDPDYIFKFISEVQQGVTIPGNDSPVNNWIFDFENFKDIIAALRNTFDIHDSLHDLKLKRMLIDELSSNLLKFSGPMVNNIEDTNAKGPIKETSNFLLYFKEKYSKRFFTKEGKLFIPDDGITISGTEVAPIVFMSTIIPTMKGLRNLKTAIIERALNEGLFINFNVVINNFEPSSINYALEKLHDWITSFKDYFKSKPFEQFQFEIAKIANDGSAHQEFLKLNFTICSGLLIFIAHSKIPELIHVVLQTVKENNLTGIREFKFDHFE